MSLTATISLTHETILIPRVRFRNTRRTILVIRSADRFSFRGTTTRTRAKLSFSGRRNGGWNAFPIRLISRFLPIRNAWAILVMFALDLTAPICLVVERKFHSRWILTERPFSRKSPLRIAQPDALRQLMPATTPTSYSLPTGAKNSFAWTRTSHRSSAGCFITFMTPGIRLPRRPYGQTQHCPGFQQSLWGRRLVRLHGWSIPHRRRW